MTSESKLQQIFQWTSLRKNWRLQTRKIVKSIKYVPSTGKTNIYDFQNNSSKYATANESALEILMWC